MSSRRKRDFFRASLTRHVDNIVNMPCNRAIATRPETAMAPTLPAKPDQRPPAGELLTYTVFNDVGLWVTYRTEDDYIVLEHGWINGRWVSLYDLLGEPQYLAWCNATEADLYADAEALARDVAEDAAIFNWQCRTGVFA